MSYSNRSDSPQKKSQPGDSQPGNYRAMEESIHTEFEDGMSYASYLRLEQLLGAQHPLTTEHDEMLFITIHQTSEIWIKQAGYELCAAIANIHDADFGHAFKVFSRVKLIFNQLTHSWNILSTLTPVDYLKFRDCLGHASGIQSYGYRKLEFLLGNKNASLLEVHRATPEIYIELKQVLEQPSLYDEVIKILASKSMPIDDEVLNRDFSLPYQHNDSVLKAWLKVYENAEQFFDLYELAEKLVDIEDAFQQWRFKHMFTVQRIIGNKMGTGGSSGVGFLKKSLDISFFPELFDLRTYL